MRGEEVALRVAEEQVDLVEEVVAADVVVPLLGIITEDVVVVVVVVEGLMDMGLQEEEEVILPREQEVGVVHRLRDNIMGRDETAM
jgi:hypothetical protein